MVKRYQNRQAADLKYDFITPAIWYQYARTARSSATFCDRARSINSKLKPERIWHLLDKAVRE